MLQPSLLANLWPLKSNDYGRELVDRVISVASQDFLSLKVMETVGPKHRAETGVAIHVGWSIGFVTLAGLAWLVRNWFWFQLVLSLCFVPYVFFYSNFEQD
ncbi:UNVERIFIED_CONTAM: hypothetical protein NCL1_08989 [Trichonephila clavipes]